MTMISQMSREELLDLVRKRREQPARVKHEPKRERDDSEDGDVLVAGEATSAASSRLTKRSKGQVEALDLTID